MEVQVGRCQRRAGSWPAALLDSPVGGQLRAFAMAVLLPIGDFRRMTHLSVRSPGHYQMNHMEGLLEQARRDRGPPPGPALGTARAPTPRVPVYLRHLIAGHGELFGLRARYRAGVEPVGKQRPQQRRLGREIRRHRVLAELDGRPASARPRVSVGKCRYSVPARMIGTAVRVKPTASELHVFGGSWTVVAAPAAGRGRG